VIKGTCRLCLNQRPLEDSHIIPEFFYRGLYDDKHRALRLEREKPRKFVQKGIRERLLCKDCEGALSKHERKFRALWYGKKTELPRHAPEDFVAITSFDYASVRILLLSILWRAGVASDARFASVELGPHQETLRRMVHEGDAGPPNTYPVYGCLLVHPKTRAVHHDFMLLPLARKIDGVHCYTFVFGGCGWQFFVGRPPIRTSFSQLYIRPDGPILLPPIKRRDFQILARFEEDVLRYEKARSRVEVE
jgi:hypothetical protein